MKNLYFKGLPVTNNTKMIHYIVFIFLHALKMISVMIKNDGTDTKQVSNKATSWPKTTFTSITINLYLLSWWRVL